MTINFSIKNLIQIAVIVLFIYFCYQAKSVILAGLFGMIAAFTLNPLVVKMEKLKIRRTVAAVVIVLVAGGALFAGIIFFVPLITADLQNLVANVPNYINVGLEYLNKTAGFFDINLYETETYEYFKEWLSEYSSNLAKWLASTVSSITGIITSTVSSVINITFYAVLVPIIAFFLLIDYPRFEQFINDYIGISKDSKIKKYFYMFNSVMASYFRGQFIVMLVLAVLYSIALSFAGLNTAILLGVLSGILSIVPYLGFAMGIAMSLIMALVQFQDLWHPLYVIIGYTIVQLIESWYVTPKIMGDTLGLHPVATILLLMAGGSIGGLLGMVFILPVASMLFRLYKEKLDLINLEILPATSGKAAEKKNDD